ncbi:CPBP family intramembrane metalloprotease [Bacillus sp. AGMB 02131]|uniref:CPBP family intramembrane metalloprotease n=1 Tax=Peribacillus faecalis TaxID=2772559 RepID=A0A927CTH9_9BACI|nr:CPBP family glutamic-type intramembrane protease [Peribacillus faecalis]MBD3106924.1 CPBP family intramembrane metalloprotease [Peribacillus faecalis]
MKRCATDVRLLLGLVGAHILIYIAYHNDNVFWYLYTAAMLFCMSYAIADNKKNAITKLPLTKNILYGFISGLLLYALFFIGNLLIDWLHLTDLAKDVKNLYKEFSPISAWHYLVLFVVIIPGEEVFWRGYIQRKLNDFKLQPSLIVIVSAILYTLPIIYSQNLALVVAAAVAGLVWAILYQWKKSLSLVIASHLVFDCILLLIFPL